MTSERHAVSQEIDAEHTAADITDEDIERARLLVGVVTANHRRDYLSQATPDAIRNFALSYGDDNPLFIDPGYGVTTRWGGQIAPPMILGAMQARMRGDPMPDDLRERTRGVFRGIHSFVAGGGWRWYQPVRPGDTIYAFGGVESLTEKPSRFAGRSVIQVKRSMKINQRAEVVGVMRTTVIFTGRRAAREAGKYKDLQLAHYTDEDLARIDAIYREERRRGAEPRYVEDVSVGERLPEVVRGPLTVTDVIVLHAGGFGFQPYGLATGPVGWRLRQQIPKFFIPDEHGVPDVSQRVHWDGRWARAIGNPDAYDYGFMRECWMQHYLLNWMGDDGWLAAFDTEIRRFNYLGDVQYLSGEVVSVTTQDGQGDVGVEVRCTNQRGEVTARARAVVLLPSRDGGPVLLPQPEPELRRQAIAMLRRHHELPRQPDGPLPGRYR